MSSFTDIGNTSYSARKCISKIELQTKFNLIHEKEWTAGDTVIDICARYNTSTKTYYKWKKRYLENGINGLQDRSRKPNNT